MNYSDTLYRKSLTSDEQDEWDRIEARNLAGGQPVFGENHPLPVRDPSEGPSKPLPKYTPPEHKLPEEDDGGWADLMKDFGGSFGGGQTSGDNFRPAFGSGNTVQSGGFGKYRGMIKSFI